MATKIATKNTVSRLTIFPSWDIMKIEKGQLQKQLPNAEPFKTVAVYVIK